MASYKVLRVVTLLTLLTPGSRSQPDVCGQAPLNTRLLGGSSELTDGEWPWMVSLQKDGRHVCAGTLVDQDSVLISADCLSSSPTASGWTVVLGGVRLNGPFKETLNVRDVTLSSQSGSNAALLRLETPPTLSNYIQPICVDKGRTFSVGSTCWAAGWISGAGGEEQVLQEIQTSVVDCEDASSPSICTEALTLEEGFSGAPLMCHQDGSWFLAATLPAGVGTVQEKAIHDVIHDAINDVINYGYMRG